MQIYYNIKKVTAKTRSLRKSHQKRPTLITIQPIGHDFNYTAKLSQHYLIALRPLGSDIDLHTLTLALHSVAEVRLHGLKI